MSKEELGLQGLDPKPESGSSQPRGDQNTPPVSYTQNLGDYQLETLEVSDPEHPVVPQNVSADFGKIYRTKMMPGRRTLLISLAITLAVVLVITIVMGVLLRKHEVPQSAASPIPLQDITFKKPATTAPSFTSELPSLLVNGDLVASGNLKVLADGFTTTIKANKPTSNQAITLPNASGVICLDSNNCTYANQADLTALSNRLTARIASIVVPPSAVTAVNGQGGSVNIQGTTNQINVNAGGGTITLSTAQDIATGSSPTFSSLVLNNNLNIGGTVTLPLNCTGFASGGKLTTNGAGQIICDNDGGSAAGAVTTAGGTNGTIPVFNGAQTIGDSIITQSGITITISGGLSVTGATSTDTLSVANGLSVVAGGINNGNGGITSAGAISGVTNLTASGNINTTGAIQTSGTSRIDNAGNLVNIGNLTATGALTIASSGAGNNIIINGANSLDVQDPTTFASTIGVSGAATFNGLATFASTVSVGNNTINGGTAVIDFTNFDVAANGSISTSGGYTQTGAGANTLTGSLTLASLANGFLEVNGTGQVSVGTIDLGTDTNGNYVSTITAGSGISGSSASEGGTPTIALSNLTTDWVQQGAFDIVLDNAASGLRMLENVGGTFYGTFDVGDLTANQTFTFTNGGIVVTSGNVATYATTGVTAGAGLVGGGTVGALTLDIGAGNGISVNANDISVIYGASANTAVEGDTTLTVSAGTNLAGGGTITLGTGGTVTLNVSDSPDFAGNLTVQGGNITIGNASQQGTVEFSDGTGFLGTLHTVALGQDTEYVLPDPASSTAEICLDNGNCAGAGSGVTAIQPSTAGRIAVFTGSQDITGSWIFQNSGTGTLELDSGKNLALLGGNLTVTGNISNTGNTTFGDATSDTVTFTARIASHLLPASNITYDLGSDTNRFRDLYLGGSSLHLGSSGNEVALTYNTGTSQAEINQDLVIINTKHISVPGAGASSEVFGAGAGAAGLSALAAGNTSTANGDNSIALGASSSASGSSSIVIGKSASDAGNGQSIVLGSSALATAPNQLVIGSSGTAINQGYFGNGVTNATPQGFVLNGTGGNGANIAGADLSLAGGKGTGTGAGGALIFQTAAGGVAGSSLNNLTERARITATGNFGIGDTTPTALLTVGNGDLFQVNASGVIAAAAGITSSGAINLTGGTVTLGSGTGATASLILNDNDAVGSETITLTLPNVTSSYVLTLPTAVGAVNQCLKAQNGTGTLFWDNCTGGAGGGLSGSGTNGRIARFTPNGTTLGDSSLTDDGTNATAVGDVYIQGGDLTVGTTTATGSIIFNDNDAVGGETVTLTTGNITSTYSLKLPNAQGSNTQCIRVDGTGQLYFDTCSGGGSGSGVNSLNTKTGDLSLQGTANQITVSSVNATTIGLSLPQDIHSGATPTFAGATLNKKVSITGAADEVQLLVQGFSTQTTNLLTLKQSGGTSVLTVTNAGNTTVGGTLQVTGASTLADVTLGTANILKTNNIAQTANGQNVTINAGTNDVIFHAHGIDFTLPSTGGASQTICTSGVTCASGGGLAVVIAPGSPQTDTSNVSTIQIDKTGTLGNLLEFTVNSAQRLTLDYNGGLSISGDLTLATAKSLFANNIAQTANGQNVSISAGNDVITFTAGGRSFIFPTSGGASQTICTTGVSCAAGGGQAVLLAPGSAQTDSSTDASLQINKTGASGNLIEFTTGSGTPVQKFTIDYSGNEILAGDLAVNGGDITSSGGLNITPGGAFVAGATGQTATFQGSVLTLTSNGAGNDVVINSADTIELQDSTNISGGLYVSNNADVDGTLSVGTSNAFQVASNGDITTNGDLYLNGGNLSANVALTIGTTGAGNDVIIDGANNFVVQDNSLLNGNVTLGTDATNTITTNGVFQGANPFVFEGATADAFEFTIAVADPTADRTYTIPNSTASTDTFCLLSLGNCVGGAGGGAPNAAAYLTIGNDATLANERAIAVNTTNLSVTDGGANGSYTINTVQDISTTSSPSFANETLSGDLTLNGGDLTSTTGALAIAPLAGSNLNINLSGTGDFVVNTNQLYVDTSSGFVGIGNSSPAALLSVGSSSQFQVNGNGSISATQTAVSGGQTAFSITPGNHTAVASEVNNFYVGGNTQTLTSGLSTQRFSLFDQPTISAGSALSTSNAATVAIAGAPARGGSATITNTSALLIQAGAVGTATNSFGLNVNAQTGATNNYAAVFQGGNVGIGDASPAGLFTVGANDAFQVNNSGAITASTGIATSGGYNQSGSTANTFSGASSFTLASGTGLSVTADATVGGKLTVSTLGTASNDTVVCRNGSGQLATCNSTFITSSSLTLQNAYSGDVDGGDTTVSLTTADDSIIFSNPASGGTDSGYVFRVEQLNTGTVAGFELTQAGTGNAFRVNDDGTFSDSSPFIIDATGKVGIGIATASALLHVQGNGSSLPSINNSTVAIFAQTLASSNSVNIALISGTSGNSRINFGDTATEGQGYFDYSNTNDSLAIGVNGATAATFNSGGNLGLGTATFGTNNRLLVNAYSTVDNLATAQINTTNAANKGLVIQGFTSQAADLLQLQDSSGNVNAKFSSSGATLTLGRIANSGTVSQGRLVFGDGTTSNLSTTLTTRTMTGLTSRTIYLPNTAGNDDDLCLLTLGNCAGSGGGVTQTGTNVSGQIAFFTGASQISSSSAFFWDNTNGRLGLNTNSPTAVLSVAALAQPTAVGGNGTAATAAVSVAGTQGGNTTSTGANTGGTGAGVTITSGTGGNATATGASTATGGTGGTSTVAGGTGGTAAGNSGTGGTGGAAVVNGGAGGAATANSATAAGGTGGAVTIASGTGGAGTGVSANGTGGAIAITAGAGGTGGSGSGGNGGTITLQGGAGGASTNGSGGNIVLQGGAKAGGAEGSVIVKPQSDNAAAFRIQTSGGSDILTVNTTTRKLIIGTGTQVLGAATSGGLYVKDSAEFAGQIWIGDSTGANGVNVDATNRQVRFSGNARNTQTLSLIPEFTGSVLHGDGASNTGYLTSDYDTTNNHAYYQWSTAETTAQDYDMYVRIPVPRDFSNFNSSGNSNVVVCYNVWTDDTATSVITAQFLDTANANAGTFTATPTSNNTWQSKCSTTQYSFTTVTVNGTSYLTLDLHFAAGSSKNTRIGEITIDYLTSF